MSVEPRGRRGFVPAALTAIVVAALAAWALRTRELQSRDARLAFRDQVIEVIGSRFGRDAAAVDGEPQTIAMGATRRDIGRLYAEVALRPEPARRQAIYLWFLGDPATASRVVVRSDPFASPPAQPAKPLMADVPPKKVKTFEVRPDGSIADPSPPR